MSSTEAKTSSSHQELESTSFFEAFNFKRIKRFKQLQPSLGVLGFVVITTFLFCFFSYSDNRYLAVRLQRFSGFRIKGSNEESRFDFLKGGGGGGECDLFDGKWVWDESYPLYQSQDCSFLDQGFRCSENGRPDLSYTKWRWQPKHCNLPRFNATLMLETLRNKRIAFVGDSIGRNQWESLLCMLSSAVPNKKSIYEVNGTPITKHIAYLVFKFEDFNCTVEYYRSTFLVLQSRPPPGSPRKITLTLKLDQMDWISKKWKNADILVLNTGHWWNYEKTIRGGCYFQEGMEIKLDMHVEDAYKRSMETVLNWIKETVNQNEIQIFFRTLAPIHFRGRDWRNGRKCQLETLPEEVGTSLVPKDNWSRFKIVNDALLANKNTSETMKFKVLNITHMSAQRKDGHSSIYYRHSSVGPAHPHSQDCSHWCLPGVPDTWNELLFAKLLKDEVDRRSNS